MSSIFKYIFGDPLNMYIENNLPKKSSNKNAKSNNGKTTNKSNPKQQIVTTNVTKNLSGNVQSKMNQTISSSQPQSIVDNIEAKQKEQNVNTHNTKTSSSNPNNKNAKSNNGTTTNESNPKQQIVTTNVTKNLSGNVQSKMNQTISSSQPQSIVYKRKAKQNVHTHNKKISSSNSNSNNGSTTIQTININSNSSNSVSSQIKKKSNYSQRIINTSYKVNANDPKLKEYRLSVHDMYNIFFNCLNNKEKHSIHHITCINAIKRLFDIGYHNDIDILFETYKTLNEDDKIKCILDFILNYYIKKRNLPHKYVRYLSNTKLYKPNKIFKPCKI